MKDLSQVKKNKKGCYIEYIRKNRKQKGQKDQIVKVYGQIRKHCIVCNEPYFATNTTIKKGKGQICSHSCVIMGKTLEDKPNWKGGKIKNGHNEIKRIGPGIHMLFIGQFVIFCLLLWTIFTIKLNNSPLKETNRKIYKVACTAYNPVPTQTDSTPRTTSIGTKVKENYTIAVSQDLLKKKIVKYGDTIYVYELGKIYSVEDCLNKRYSNRLDIFMESKKEARKFGLRIVHFSVLGGGNK